MKITSRMPLRDVIWEQITALTSYFSSCVTDDARTAFTSELRLNNSFLKVPSPHTTRESCNKNAIYFHIEGRLIYMVKKFEEGGHGERIIPHVVHKGHLFLSTAALSFFAFFPSSTSSTPKCTGSFICHFCLSYSFPVVAFIRFPKNYDVLPE